MKLKFCSLLLAILPILSSTISAQDSISLQDYQRASKFLYENYHDKVFNLSIRAHWFPDSSGVWYINESPEQKKYLKVTFPEHQQFELFDHKKLAQLLSDSLEADINADQLPIQWISYESPTQLKFRARNKTYLLNTETYTLTIPEREKKNDECDHCSPDEQWQVYSEDYNLFIKSKETGETRQLSTAGKKGYEYASWYGWADIIEGENGERPEHFGVNWSKDSKWISTQICDLRSAEKMYLLDWSVDTLYRPRLLSYYRGSPGDTGMVYLEPVFFNVATGEEIKPDLPRSTHINSIGVTWSEIPGKVYLQRLDRGYQKVTVHTFDLTTNKLEALYTQTSETNIDNFSYQLAEKSNLMFFLSEKSGWRQLYSLSLKNKKEKALTQGAFYIHSIERIDEENKKIFFLASGREKGVNPYYQQLYSISFSGKNLQLLTPENLNHEVSLSPDGLYLVDNQSTVETPTETVLRSALTGKIITKMGRADVSSMGNWSPPQAFKVLAADGKTDIYGAIWKPTNFDPNKSYPIIESSYTGPHTQVFPRSFSRAIGYQSFAELGFVVLVVDGRGSFGRSKAFHDYSYKNLGGGLTDHVAAIKQLGRQYSWMDTTRVGIFGHSAGGYDAGHAVLAYPDFYKVAVASSADHDHRMEKAWWPEMYMGWPVDSAYHLQSNITMAGNLQGKLLLTHGGIDENVNPSATFKMAEALIKADKQFDMLILPSQRHGYSGQHQKYFRKKRWNYFIEHLRGVEPIWDIE